LAYLTSAIARLVTDDKRYGMSESRRASVRWLAVFAALTLLSACAARAPGTTSPGGPGFFAGLWHGLVAPIAFLIHLFIPSVAVYATPNDGAWYDFGFLFGIAAISGGTSGQLCGIGK
jgi:hypothetical protein